MAHITLSDIENVMVVAGHLFAEKGYEGVGIREIAAKSGIKVSAILYHFGSKESLYEDVLEYRYRALMEIIEGMIKGLGDPEQKLEILLGTLFDTLSRDREMLLLIQRDITEVVAAGTEHKRRPGFASEYPTFLSWICQLLEKVLDRTMERSVAVAISSLLMGYSVITAASGECSLSDQERAERYAQQRADLITFGKRICELRRTASRGTDVAFDRSGIGNIGRATRT